MRQKLKYLWSSLVIALLILSGCKSNDSSGNSNSAPVFTKDIGWAMENIDTTYWSKGGGNAVGVTMFFNVWVYLSDADGTSDITNVTVTDPEGYYWVLRDTASGEDKYDATGGFLEVIDDTTVAAILIRR